MISIEDAKNQEDLFQIKAAIMSKKLKEVGDRNGVMEILSLSLDAYKNKDYQKSLKILEPLINALKEQPFVSNDSVAYVAISDEMEWVLYQHFYQNPSQQIKNVSVVCPMDWIYRQYALAALDLGDYSTALKGVTEAVQWNPTSAKCRILYAMLCSAEGHWENLLKEIVSALKFTYRSSDMVHCLRFLKDYFLYKKMYKEAVYCSFLRSRFSSSQNVLLEIVGDMAMLVQRVNFDYKSINDEDMVESCKRYGFTPGFNPEVIAVAQDSYEDAFLAKESGKAAYFAQIMEDLKTEQEKRDAVSLRQLIENHRNPVS
jgi:tetratricopeptide (TPR) repeat protein